MHKFLFATDLHFRASRPVSRLDRDFMTTLLGKVDEFREIAEAEKVDAVILGGDIFDREDAPHSVVIKVNRAFKKFKVPVYTLIGNHDIYGYEGKTVDVSCIGSLFEMGSVKRLDALQFGDSVAMYGIHAFDKDEWTVPDSGPDCVNILVVHKMITDTQLPEGSGCIMVDEVADKTNADVVLSGDIHFPHEVQREGCLFVNPGSMTRLSIDDRDRQPQISILTISDKLEIHHEFRTLSTRPSECIFDLKAYSNRMASKLHTDEFVRTYAHAVISVKAEAHEIGKVLMTFLEKNGVGEDLQGMAKDYLARANKAVLQEVKE